jgi:hypothetical protein
MHGRGFEMPSEKRRRLLGRLIHKAETLRRTLDVGVKSDTVRKTRRAWVTSAKESLVAAEFEDIKTIAAVKPSLGIRY